MHSFLSMPHFNSQPHEEADWKNPNGMQPGEYFNSQPHEEADCDDSLNRSLQNYFNSQPHEEADEMFSANFDIEKNFNSQPHEEADQSTHLFAACPCISTHSLTKRLTLSKLRNMARNNISTHSLTKRLTGRSGRGNQKITFQLTASRRG